MTRRIAVVALALIVGLAAQLAPSAPASAATSVSCATAPAPITDQQRAAAWDLAAIRLAALDGPATSPFGATGSGGYRRTSAYAWTSGFFPASLWLMYDHTDDPAWLSRARRYTRAVLPVADWTGSHDLGFMVGLPAGLGLGADPSVNRGTSYARAIIDAAQSLSTRWNSKVRAIRSGEYGGRWGLIIDSAMNAPLLMEAGLVLGGVEGRRLYLRGDRHLVTLRRHLVRADGSTRHRVAFDARTGRELGPIAGQGLGAQSTWARGQAWAIRGFARGYELAPDARLLETARATSDYWIAHVPAGCVPAWDLDVTDPDAPRDSSAAAIAADGLLLMANVDPDPARAAAYRQYATTTLGTLVAPPWLTTDPAGRGLLQRQSYNVPADAREGTYAWGDTYLLSALRRSG